MNIRKPSLLSACVAIIWGCILALDFVTGSAKIAFICIAILAGGAVGFIVGRTGGSRLVPKVKGRHKKSGAARPDGSFVLASRSATIKAMSQWGRDDDVAQALGRHLTSLGVFDSEGHYTNGVEALTVDRVLQIFDEFLEEGVPPTELPVSATLPEAIPIGTVQRSPNDIGSVLAAGSLAEPKDGRILNAGVTFRPDVPVELAA